MELPPLETPTTLVCAECVAESSDDAEGWRAYLTLDAVAMFCPECAEREFG
jgi:hypothetical protein